ncbi:DNA-binding transcriptional regulator, LysR family [Microbacterium sp. cf046]|uniref:LysR family transcriptional regulator n=1 Tax=Microbacterium sp. cf046 TaxID=1761803 RepID=UPI0008E2D731|nr:LysR substrate-binding domain-containing protein [Microbacterium sp. cf046]SFS16948.1 DNA-binding transcriptional regulator, LysR family [Microbacterium sp. cf046]
MSISRLQYFVAVAQERSFARAAARLHISRPALSQQIRRLEEELGQQLVARTSHRVMLTAAGRALFPEAREIVDGYRRLGGIVDEAARGTATLLRIGANASSIIGVMPQLIAAFRGVEAHTAVVIEQLWDEQQVEMIRAGELDLAVFRSREAPEDLECFAFPPDRLHVCLPLAHRLAGREVVEWSELAGEHLLVPDRARARIEVDTVLSAFTVNGVHLDYTVISHQGYHGASWVQAGYGILVVPGYATALRQDGTVFRPLAPAQPAMQLWIARRPEVANPSVDAFIEIARSIEPAHAATSEGSA